MSGLLESFHDPAVVALSAAADHWPRRLLAPTLIPDGWIGLITAADGRRWFAPGGEDPRPPRGGRLLLVRNRPLVVPLSCHQVYAACGADCDAELELLVRWPPREEELAALQRSGLAEPKLRVDQLAAAVAAGGAAAGLARWIESRSAEALVGTDQRDGLREALRSDLRAFSFETGLELAGVARAVFSSRMLAHRQARLAAAANQRAEIDARRMVQQASLAAARQHLAGVAELLAALEQAAERSRLGGWSNLLAALGPPDRGRLLESLWRISPRRAHTTVLFVLTTRELAWLDPHPPHELRQRRTLPLELGPPRALAWDTGSDQLWLGAAHGLWRLDPDTGAVLGRHELPAAAVARDGGGRFSRILPLGETVIAAHPTLGLWRFSRDNSTPGQPLAGGCVRAGVAAALCRVAVDRFACATEAALQLRTLEGELLHELPCPLGTGRIHALAAEGGRLFVATEAAGLLETCWEVSLPSGAAPAGWRTIWPAVNPVESVVPRRWGDVLELLLPAGNHGITALYPEAQVEVPLSAAPFPIRRVWATDDLVVGLSTNRDRLFVATEAAPPGGGVAVDLARTLGDLLADVALRTRPAEPSSSSGDR